MTMPNKTIYVADADLSVFDRAQELAGENLSATIAQALRRFIETEEARTQGFGEITLKVGRQMTYTRKQFLGREVARHRSRDEESSRLITQTVFQTAKGRLVLYTRATPDWNAWTSYWSDWGRDFAGDWSEWGRDFAKGWDQSWSVDVDVDVDPHRAHGQESREEREARARARAEAKAQAKAEARARREEWRERMREARQSGKPGRADMPRFDWSTWTEGGEYDMEVYDTLDDLKPHISEEFYAAVAQRLRGDDVEFLDI
jgi:EXLDI family protein